MKQWIRKCTRCGNKQSCKKPKPDNPTPKDYLNNRCRKCHERSLTYGEEVVESYPVVFTLPWFR